MNIAVLNTQIPFIRGGAEILAEDLLVALQDRGYNATLVTVPFKWYPQLSLTDSILACKLTHIEEASGLRIDKAIPLRFPLWLTEHGDMSPWVLHQHRAAYDLWDTDYNDLASMPDGHRIREMIFREDQAAISKCSQVYTISQNVSDRLHKYNGIDSGVLYPPPRSMEKYFHKEYGNYFLYPSRINPLKRQSLVVEALAFTTPDIKVVFVGQADDSNYHETLKQRAEELGVTDRITWLGHVSEQEKFDLYAGCHMVLFPTFDEDYGYIAPEAMLSSKGVITLEDSGGALEFVLHDETGCVARPEAEALAHEMDRTWANRPLARTYGENANTRVSSMNISWDKVVECLIQT